MVKMIIYCMAFFNLKLAYDILENRETTFFAVNRFNRLKVVVNRLKIVVNF